MNRWKEKQYLSVAAIIMAVVSMVLPGTIWGVGTPTGTVLSSGGDGGTPGVLDPADVLMDYSESPSLVTTTGVTTSTIGPVYDIINLTNPSDQSSGANSTVYFSYGFDNGGNTLDSFTVSAVVTAGATFTTTIYADDGAGGGVANDGIHQSGETTVVSSTGNIAAGATYRFFVAITIPSGTPNGATAAVTLTVKDQGGLNGNDGWGINPDTFTDTTNTTTITAVLILVITVDKSTVRPDNPGVPGTPTLSSDASAALTYSIQVTNTGSAPGTNVNIRAKAPNFTVMIPGTLKLDGVTLTDVPDGDQGDLNVTVANGIKVTLPSVLNGGPPIVIQYSVYVQ